MNSPLSSESALTLLKKVPMEESRILLPPNDDLVTESLHIFQPVRHRHIIIILHKSAGGGGGGRAIFKQTLAFASLLFSHCIQEATEVWYPEDQSLVFIDAEFQILPIQKGEIANN